MLYALVDHSPVFVGKMRKAILLAPCTQPIFEYPGALKMYEAGIDVYEFSGPDWEEQKLKACSVVSESICDQLNFYDKLESTSVKANAHMAQLSSTNRFQKFVESWPNTKNGIEVDIGYTKGVSVSLYVNQFDEVCSAFRAEALDAALDSVVDKYNLITDNRGHTYFTESNAYAADVADEI